MNRWILAAYLYVAALAATLAMFVEGCSGQRSDASVAARPPPTPVRVEAVRLERVAPPLVVPAGAGGSIYSEDRAGESGDPGEERGRRAKSGDAGGGASQIKWPATTTTTTSS